MFRGAYDEGNGDTTLLAQLVASPLHRQLRRVSLPYLPCSYDGPHLERCGRALGHVEALHVTKLVTDDDDDEDAAAFEARCRRAFPMLMVGAEPPGFT